MRIFVNGNRQLIADRRDDYTCLRFREKMFDHTIILFP